MKREIPIPYGVDGISALVDSYSSKITPVAKATGKNGIRNVVTLHPVVSMGQFDGSALAYFIGSKKGSDRGGYFIGVGNNSKGAGVLVHVHFGAESADGAELTVPLKENYLKITGFPMIIKDVSKEFCRGNNVFFKGINATLEQIAQIAFDTIIQATDPVNVYIG